MTQGWAYYLGIILAIVMVVLGLLLLMKKPKSSMPAAALDVESTSDSTTDFSSAALPLNAPEPEHTLPLSGSTLNSDQADTVVITSHDTSEEVASKLDAIAHHESANSTVTTTSLSDHQVAQNSVDAAVPVTGSRVSLGVDQKNSPPDALDDDLNEILAQLDPASALIAQDATVQQNDRVAQFSQDRTLGNVDFEKGDLDALSAQQPTVSVDALRAPALTGNVLDSHLSEQDRRDEESTLAMAQQIFALYLYPDPQRVLSGEKALKMLTRYGLRYGEMACFHRYQDSEKVSPLMFSVLRLDEHSAPTGFDLERFNQEEIKGLAFFLALPHPDAATGFDMMASLSGLMARDVNGMVFDENGLELTGQLKEHWRQEVIELNSQLISHTS